MHCFQNKHCAVPLTFGQGDDSNKVEGENRDWWPMQLVSNDAKRDKDQKDIDLGGEQDGLEACQNGGPVMVRSAVGYSKDGSVVSWECSLKRTSRTDGDAPIGGVWDGFIADADHGGLT